MAPTGFSTLEKKLFLTVILYRPFSIFSRSSTVFNRSFQNKNWYSTWYWFWSFFFHRSAGLDLLIEHMEHCAEVKGLALNWFKYDIKQRTFPVNIGKYSCVSAIMTSGVPRWSVLKPVLIFFVHAPSNSSPMWQSGTLVGLNLFTTLTFNILIIYPMYFTGGHNALV